MQTQRSPHCVFLVGGAKSPPQQCFKTRRFGGGGFVRMPNMCSDQNSPDFIAPRIIKRRGCCRSKPLVLHRLVRDVCGRQAILGQTPPNSRLHYTSKVCCPFHTWLASLTKEPSWPPLLHGAACVHVILAPPLCTCEVHTRVSLLNCLRAEAPVKQDLGAYGVADPRTIKPLGLTLGLLGVAVGQVRSGSTRQLGVVRPAGQTQ